MSLWDYITRPRRARAVPVRASDAPTEPIPVIVSPNEDAAKWLEDLYDKQARLIAETKARGWDWASEADHALAGYIPGMPLDRETAALLEAAGVGRGCPQAAPGSTQAGQTSDPRVIGQSDVNSPAETLSALRGEIS